MFCPDFYSASKGVPLIGTRVHQLNADEMNSLLEPHLAKLRDFQPLNKAPWQEPAVEDFALGLQQIHSRIEQKTLQKAVPVIFSRSAQAVTADDRLKMLGHLLKAPPTLYVYGFWDEEGGVIGATPEVLLEYLEGRLETMALAGTCPKSESSDRQSLLQDPKEMHEHNLVVADIVAELKKLGTVSTSATKILELPTLYHLKTEISVQCKAEPDLIRTILQLHPTPALGVAPRSAGIEWMKALPGQEGRGRYGAPFALMSGQEALCLVGIRNLQWNKDFAMIGSGCGIVAGSELNREWRELEQKRLSVRKILGLERG